MTTMTTFNRVQVPTSAASFVLAAALLLGAGCSEQPKNRCKVAPGLAIAKYTMKGAPSGTCTGVKLPGLGESVGMQPYVPNPTGANAADEVTTFSIKPQWLGERIAEARDSAAIDPALAAMKDALVNYPYGSAAATPPPTDLTTTKRPYAYGKFASVFPDDNGICTAAGVNASDLVYPAIPAHVVRDADQTKPPMMVAAEPETSVKYEWTNLRTIQTPASPGTQTFGDLTVTRDGCSVSYGAAILVPRVGCAKMDAGGKAVADETACDPAPNATNLFGSGISPGVPTKCEDVAGDPANPDFVCVPTKTAP
jgi:hypothetical protein